MNARAAIGGDGVKSGYTEYDAREVYADEIAKRLAGSDACESEQDLSSKGFEIEVVQRLECHHRKVSCFGFGELFASPSDYLDAAPPVAKEASQGANEGTLVTGIALERRGSRRHGLLGRREDVACGRRTRYVLRTLDKKGFDDRCLSQAAFPLWFDKYDCQF